MCCGVGKWGLEGGVNWCRIEEKVDGIDGRGDNEIQIVSVFIILLKRLIRQEDSGMGACLM